MLTAHPQLQLRSYLASEPGGHPDHRANALAVDRLERGAIDDVCAAVLGQDPPLDVVAREPEAGLRQVVCAEGEEVRVLGDLTGYETGARQLDHRAEAKVPVVIEALFLSNPAH